MANPICLSPLKFYDSLAKQEFRKSYAYGHISPLINEIGHVSAFQFAIPKGLASGIQQVSIVAATGQSAIDVTTSIIDAGLSLITSYDECDIILYRDSFRLNQLAGRGEGQFYIVITLAGESTIRYYSEIFCCTSNLSDCIKIEYYNSVGEFTLKDGVITFVDNFAFKLYLKTEVGKPEYEFEEEATKRLGYTFVESQVSKKIYKFNVVIPEFLCDAMRLIRLCDEKKLTCKEDVYDMLTFEMDVDWQTQGDLASVTCEFETDNVLVNLGGFIREQLGGDFLNSDFNRDFLNQ